MHVNTHTNIRIRFRLNLCFFDLLSLRPIHFECFPKIRSKKERRKREKQYFRQIWNLPFFNHYSTKEQGMKFKHVENSMKTEL